MRILRVESRQVRVPLTRPYAIAGFSTDAVDIFYVRLVTAGTALGIGAATPAAEITGETVESCGAALTSIAPGFLEGRDARHLGELTAAASAALSETPAARAAIDMALHDLCARQLDVPLVELLGQRRDPLPTSVTIGILPVEETLAQAEEHVEHGFRCLKIKIGRDADEDLERLRKLRERCGGEIAIRVDANEGYALADARRILDAVFELDLELVEQPLPAGAEGELRELPPALRARVALDESVHDEGDALRLTRDPLPCGTLVLKLMKSGGVTSALGMARIADLAGVGLMWGCMDESVVSIAAALHAAYASPATRYIDLDGSFDLSADQGSGGFALREGRLELLDEPGLGARLDE